MADFADGYIFDELDEEGCGMTKLQLVNAVQFWSLCQPGEGGQIVAEAAKLFNVTPKFLADAIRQVDNPFFFLSDRIGDTAKLEFLTLEHDGL